MQTRTHSKSMIKNQVGAAGELFLVATPIGNLADITLRALDILKTVDLIACEDTRTSGVLLAHYGIATKTVSYHSHNEAASAAGLVEQLQQGKRIALVSDAGTPLLSDPGARLVAACAEAGIRVTPIPGASALLSALTISALPPLPFHFAGFLPTKKKERDAILASLQRIEATLAFYEAPHRLLETLEALQQNFGDRQAAVARELTKLYEECIRSTLSELTQHFTATAPRGECVILVGGAAPAEGMDDAALDCLLKELLTTQSLKDAVDEATRASGRARSAVYSRALALK